MHTVFSLIFYRSVTSACPQCARETVVRPSTTTRTQWNCILFYAWNLDNVCTCVGWIREYSIFVVGFLRGNYFIGFFFPHNFGDFFSKKYLLRFGISTAILIFPKYKITRQFPLSEYRRLRSNLRFRHLIVSTSFPGAIWFLADISHDGFAL